MELNQDAAYLVVLGIGAPSTRQQSGGVGQADVSRLGQSRDRNHLHVAVSGCHRAAVRGHGHHFVVHWRQSG